MGPKHCVCWKVGSVNFSMESPTSRNRVNPGQTGMVGHSTPRPPAVQFSTASLTSRSTPFPWLVSPKTHGLPCWSLIKLGLGWPEGSLRAFALIPPSAWHKYVANGIQILAQMSPCQCSLLWPPGQQPSHWSPTLPPIHVQFLLHAAARVTFPKSTSSLSPV